MTSIYIPSSTSSGGGELAGQVYGKTSNTIISTTAVMNKPLTGLTAMTGAVVASDSILTGISKLSGNAGAATSNNVVNQIVKRDATGGFSAGIITTSGLSDGNSLILQTTSNLTRLGVNNGPTATGVNNTIVGVNAMNANSTASSNCMIGSLAGGAITSGGENTFVGHLTGNTAGVGVNSGSRNTLIGTGAITAAVNQTNSIAIGYAAQAPASNTVRFGNDSITNVYTTGVLNAGGLESIGTILNIASANNTNTVNICNGTGAQTINMGSTGAGVTTINLGGGSDIVKVNLPLKDSAGVNIIDIPTSNCMIGKNVLNNLNATSSSCTAVGVNIGGSNAENNTSNTFFGRDIAQSSTGSYSYCTAVGHGALKVVNSVNNTATGFNSLNELTTGLNNTGFGIRSGTAHTPLTTGSNNTFIGATSGSDNANRSNGTAIGQNARVDFDNCVQLGNTLVTQVRTSGTLYALGLESIGSTLSIASANNTNTVNIGSGAAVQTINVGNNGSGATTITLGGTTDSVKIGSRATCDNIISFGLQSKTKHIALFNATALDPNNQDDQRFYGFGVNDGGVMVPLEAGVGWLRYQVPVNMQHRFYTGIDASTSNERFRLDGTGKVSLGNGGSLEALSGALTIGASTSIVNIGTSSAAQTINIGAGTGVTSVNIGNANDIVTFGNGCKLPTTGGAAATLNHYEEFTFSTALSGAAALPTNYINFIRIGSLVTMTVSTPISFTATATSTLVNSSAIPERFRPNGYEQCSHIEIQANGVNGDGMARVSAAGNLTLGTAHFGSFTNGQPCQVYPFAMSWSIVS